MHNPNHRQNGDFRAGNRAAQRGPEPADHIVTLRVPRATKGRWVRESRRVQGRSLSRWIIETLDGACPVRDEDNRDQNSP